MLNDIISIKNPKSQAAEAFRTLRTNIQFSSLDEDLKTIVVSSTQPGEGKSTIVTNLAVTMAQSGKRVLLIDCDLSKPTIHKKLGISNQDGLTTLIAKEKSLEEVISETSVHNFFVITSGPIPPNPAELLGSKKMRHLIEQLKEDFDVILFDTPPILAVTDAQILSTYCSGVVFVAGYSKAEKQALLRAQDLINKVGGKLLGVVINKVPNNSRSYYYYNYDYK
jgi:capsular exopolysaccharide synthesis family protein